jgi:glucarate dehydratase
MRSTGELGVGTAAILHLAAATPAMRHPHQTVLHLLEDDVTQERLRIHRGYVEVPGAPGLGIALDEAKVRAYARLHTEQGTYWFWGERHQPRWQPPTIW